MKKVGWLLGWAVPETWFAAHVRAAWPEATHEFVAPSSNSWCRLAARGPYDLLVGYSLGSLLLLREVDRAAQLSGGRVALLAPIFAFPAESDAGGRVSVTQLRVLRRWMKKEPDAARTDFYTRTGLDVPPDAAGCFCGDELQWGLDRLERDEVPPKLPEGWRAWCGDADPLLDATRLTALVPTVRVIPGGTHHPATLLGALREEFR